MLCPSHAEVDSEGNFVPCTPFTKSSNDPSTSPVENMYFAKQGFRRSSTPTDFPTDSTKTLRHGDVGRAHAGYALGLATEVVLEELIEPMRLPTRPVHYGRD